MKVRLLMLEDDESDSLLVEAALVDYGIDLEYRRLDSKKELRVALSQEQWDAVTCDFSMPRFSAQEALRIVREHDPDIPFILVSGNVEPLVAVEMMRGGMQDYVMKDQLERLGPAIQREVREAKSRRRERAAQLQVLAAQERFQNTFEQSAVGIAQLDLDLTVVWANERLAQLLGYEREELVGRACAMLTWPEDKAEEDKNQQKLLAGEIQQYSSQKRYMRKNGTPIWTLLTLTAIHDRSGQISYLTSIVQDISEQKRAEEELAATTAFINATIKSLPFELVVTDRTGRISMYNEKWREFSASQGNPSLKGASIGDSYFETCPKTVRSELQRVLDGEEHLFSHEYPCHTPGQLRWFLMEAAPLDVEQGGLVISHIEITDRVRVERELEKREKEYRTIVNSMKDGLVVIDQNQIARFVNPALCEMTGYSEEEIIGQDLFRLLLPEDLEKELRQTAIERWGDDSHVYELPATRRDGTDFYVRANVSAQYDQNGDLAGRLAVVSDLTDAKRADEEQRRLQKKIDELNRLESLGKLAGTMAHEFNNVLMGILPFVDVIERSCDSEDARIRQSTRFIADAVGRGRRVSQEVLRFARPQAPTRASQSTDELLEDVRIATIGVLGDDYTLEIEQLDELSVTVDREQIIQVFTNLIINARDASGPGSRITLSVGQPDPAGEYEFGIVDKPECYAHFRVTDEGSGIEESMLNQIFDPMVSTKASGTGLGLAVSYQIIAAHGGHVFVESTVGEGATFHLFLPLSSAEAACAPGSDSLNETVASE